MTTQDPQSTTEETLSRRSPLKKFGLPAGLLAGGVALGMAFAPVGLAGAQDDTEPEDAPADETEDGDRGEGRRRGGRGFGSSETVEELTGLTREEIREGFTADPPQTLAEQAAAAGVSQDELVGAIVSDIEAKIAEAVAEGRLTQERADEKIADLEARVTEKVTTVPTGGHGRGKGHRGARFEALEELGLTREEVRAGFQEGQTLAETAAAEGISEDALVDALVASAMERVDAAVESGRITQEEADEKTADLEANISERVNADPADRPERSRFGRGGADAEAQTTSLDA